MQVLGLATPPSPTDIGISTDGNDVESANDVEHWCDIADEVDDDGDDRKCDETGDLDGVVFTLEAESMDDLGDEKDQDAGFSGIIDGEDDVGGKSDEAGELEEMVAWIRPEGVDKTEENAA